MLDVLELAFIAELLLLIIANFAEHLFARRISIKLQGLV
jgi:hypothetical protein